MNKNAAAYFVSGCGRCPLGGTPACKVNTWTDELAKLRSIVLSCGLTEESKWGVPCYTFESRNIVMIHALKDSCALDFFKGVLLKDTEGILIRQTQNMQAARHIRFTNIREVVKMEATLKAYIQEAIDVEKAGFKVAYKKTADFAIPEELQSKLDEIPALKRAFNALTPGRQRGYLLHFSAPKQSKTRESRVARCIPRILEGKGLND